MRPNGLQAVIQSSKKDSTDLILAVIPTSGTDPTDFQLLYHNQQQTPQTSSCYTIIGNSPTDIIIAVIPPIATDPNGLLAVISQLARDPTDL